MTAWQSDSPEVFNAAVGLIRLEAEAQGCVRCSALNLQPLNRDASVHGSFCSGANKLAPGGALLSEKVEQGADAREQAPPRRDRTSLNLAVWLPLSEQAGGAPAIWPNSPPIPLPRPHESGGRKSAMLTRQTFWRPPRSGATRLSA